MPKSLLTNALGDIVKFCFFEARNCSYSHREKITLPELIDLNNEVACHGWRFEKRFEAAGIQRFRQEFDVQGPPVPWIRWQ
jgi:hypothetical protein